MCDMANKEQGMAVLNDTIEVMKSKEKVVRWRMPVCTMCLNIRQGQKLFKKESDVGMLLTGIQSTETRCM